MKTSYCYWAGPWKPAGPWPHSAYSDRAEGSAAAWLGASAHDHLAQLGRGEGPCRRRDATAARLRQRAGGHCRPVQGKRASTRGSQASVELEQAARKGGGGEEG